MMRKAFTLIELLVVIAIIAILAAILFPVFAQAKLAAKAAASISNSKQINLAHIMYAGDYDDSFSIANVWDSPTANFSIGGVLYNNWVWNIYPYMKNADIMADPLAPPVFTGGFSKVNQSTATPTYGYNYATLSPSFYVSGAWRHTALTQSGLAKPSETVLLTTRFEQITESTLPYNYLWWYGARSITTMAAIDPPDCATIAQYCFDNWGHNGFWNRSGGFQLTKDSSQYSAGVAVRGAGQVIVAMTDGSAKKMTASGLAAGTNWRTGTSFLAANLQVTDRSKYLWDEQ